MSIKTLLAHKSTYFWLALGWTVFVAVLCLMNGSDLPRIGVKGVDKYVHFIFHFVFAFLWFMYGYIKTVQPIAVAQCVLVASLLFGIFIELAQAYLTTSRNPDVFDVLANASGALVALSVMLLTIHFTNLKT